MQAELTAQRNLVRALPQLWQLTKLVSLLPAAERKPKEPTLRHQATIARRGIAAAFTMPQPLTPIPLDQPCMPSLLSPPSALHMGNAQSGPMPNSTHLPPNMPHKGPITPTGSANVPPPAQPGGDPTADPAQQGTQAGHADVAAQSINSPNCTSAQQASRHVPLHQDTVCQSNPTCQEADLIMSEGAYECLFGTWAPVYKGGWELPVTVQAKTTPFTGQTEGFTQPQQKYRQQVIIDSPLPQRMLSLREKHEMLYQHAVRKHGHDLWVSQQQARKAEQSQPELDPLGMPVQQHPRDDEAGRPYSPTNDMPCSPGNVSTQSDQHSIYDMPALIAPTAADLPGAASEIAYEPDMQQCADAAYQPDMQDDANMAYQHEVEEDSEMDLFDGDGADADDGVSDGDDNGGAASTVAYVPPEHAHDADPLPAHLAASLAQDAAGEDGTADAEAGNGPTADATGPTSDGAGPISENATAELGSGNAGMQHEVVETGSGYDSWKLGPLKVVTRSQLPFPVVHNPPAQVSTLPVMSSQQL